MVVFLLFCNILLLLFSIRDIATVNNTVHRSLNVCFGKKKKKKFKGTTPLSALCTSKCVKGCILRYRLSHFQVWVITPEFWGGCGGNRAKSLEGDGMHCGPRYLLSLLSPLNLELLSWFLNETVSLF